MTTLAAENCSKMDRIPVAARRMRGGFNKQAAT